MWNKIAFAKKYLVYNIPICMILGIIFGYFNGQCTCAIRGNDMADNVIVVRLLM